MTEHTYKHTLVLMQDAVQSKVSSGIWTILCENKHKFYETTSFAKALVTCQLIPCDLYFLRAARYSSTWTRQRWGALTSSLLWQSFTLSLRIFTSSRSMALERKKEEEEEEKVDG